MAARGLAYWLILKPLSWLLRLGLSLASGLASPRPRSIAGAKLVSVGNLSVGGTGKTPLVIALANRLKRRHRVCVISRGYGRQVADATVLVSGGKGPQVDSALSGDEPALVARRCPGVRVLVDHDRRRAALFAVEQLGCDLLILDDGFRHARRLAVDLNLLLADPPGLPGSSELLPAGRLRELPSAAALAHAAVLRPGQANPWPALPALRVERKPGRLRGKGRVSVKGRAVAALSGIGHPAAFEESLASLGASRVKGFRFPDHHPYTAADLARVLKDAAREGLDLVVTTEKDEIRLAGLPGARKVAVLELDVQLKPEKDWKRALAALED